MAAPRNGACQKNPKSTGWGNLAPSRYPHQTELRVKHHGRCTAQYRITSISKELDPRRLRQGSEYHTSDASIHRVEQRLAKGCHRAT